MELPATPWFGHFSLNNQKIRTVFLIDGLNMYHSARQAAGAHPNIGISPWIDIKGLCDKNLYVLSTRAVNYGIQYFTTLSDHLEKVRVGARKADKTYLEVLDSTGISITLGRFKKQRTCCSVCYNISSRFEEKETDVAIASRLIELAVTYSCNATVLVSGDTDLIPAIRTAKTLSPKVKIWIAFPFGRFNHELTQVADGFFKLSHSQYITHQLPPTVKLKNGRVIKKPEGW